MFGSLTVDIEYGHLCMFSFQSVKYNLLFRYINDYTLWLYVVIENK